MSKSNDHFKQLQREWYRKLADSGFKDIERNNSDSRFSIRLFHDLFRNTTAINMEFQEEYFRFLGIMVNDDETIFKTELDRYMLTRFAEGIKINIIVDELKGLGSPKDRKTVRTTIKRYETAWKLKVFKNG